MTLDPNDPLYKLAIESGLNDAQINGILKQSGKDGLSAVVGRKLQHADDNSDDGQTEGWEEEFVVETVGVDTKPSCFVTGCLPAIIGFFVLILTFGIGEKLLGDYMTPQHPVLSIVIAFGLLIFAGLIIMGIFSLIQRPTHIVFALLKKNWWKILLALWGLGWLLSLIFPAAEKPTDKTGTQSQPASITQPAQESSTAGSPSQPEITPALPDKSGRP